MDHTGIVADPLSRKHDTGTGHPERPERFSAVLNRLEAGGVFRDLAPLPHHEASNDELALVHTREYISLVEREVEEGRPQLSTGDTTLSAGALISARIAAGAVISAVEAVFTRSVLNAFCLVRPPGHHASADRGMGFCLFNNAALGAKYAQQAFGAERILIADWDVHHGNGTQDIFYEDGSVLFFSTHQSPWYPHTGAKSERGEGAGAGLTINCPFPARSGRKEILGAFQDILIPAAAKFQPDLVLISAGFDSRAGDPLGQFNLTDVDFADLTALMADIASRYCDSRLVSILEGGYNLEGLARASEAHVRTLLGH
jgi:acetoin utilization deacetylase AcuC-like enzyme